MKTCWKRAAKTFSRGNLIHNFLLKNLITGRAFVPPPDVDVGVVHLVPRVKPLINLPFPLVEKIARHIFHYRQKYCRRGVE